MSNKHGSRWTVVIAGKNRYWYWYWYVIADRSGYAVHLRVNCPGFKGLIINGHWPMEYTLIWDFSHKILCPVLPPSRPSPAEHLNLATGPKWSGGPSDRVFLIFVQGTPVHSDQVFTDAIISEHALTICYWKICQLVAKQQYYDYHISLKATYKSVFGYFSKL